jgi:hypothetical protein
MKLSRSNATHSLLRWTTAVPLALLVMGGLGVADWAASASTSHPTSVALQPDNPSPEATLTPWTQPPVDPWHIAKLPVPTLTASNSAAPAHRGITEVPDTKPPATPEPRPSYSPGSVTERPAPSPTPTPKPAPTPTPTPTSTPTTSKPPSVPTSGPSSDVLIVHNAARETTEVGANGATTECAGGTTCSYTIADGTSVTVDGANGQVHYDYSAPDMCSIGALTTCTFTLTGNLTVTLAAA